MRTLLEKMEQVRLQGHEPLRAEVRRQLREVLQEHFCREVRAQQRWESR
jgi:hypothetical protein